MRIKTVQDKAFSLSKVVYREVEIFKIYLNINKLDLNMQLDMAKMGEKMFQIREKDLSMLKEDKNISMLADKIQQAKGLYLYFIKEKNSYFIKYYNYVFKLLNKIYN
jgi:hypothetical protein